MTVRGLGEATRLGLRRAAAARGMSVEALAREAMVALAAGEGAKPAGFAEQSVAWPAPMPPAAVPGFADLHGALAGWIHAGETDLTAPVGEIWKAEGAPG